MVKIKRFWSLFLIFLILSHTANASDKPIFSFGCRVGASFPHNPKVEEGPYFEIPMAVRIFHNLWFETRVLFLTSPDIDTGEYQIGHVEIWAAEFSLLYQFQFKKIFGENFFISPCIGTGYYSPKMDVSKWWQYLKYPVVIEPDSEAGFHCGIDFEYFINKHTAISFYPRFLYLVVDYEAHGAEKVLKGKAKFTGGLLSMGIKFYF